MKTVSGGGRLFSFSVGNVILEWRMNAKMSKYAAWNKEKIWHNFGCGF